MAEPRKYKDVKRIIRQAKHESAHADLKEFDSLLAQRIDFDPSVKLTGEQKKRKSERQRRLKVLGRRLFKETR